MSEQTDFFGEPIPVHEDEEVVRMLWILQQAGWFKASRISRITGWSDRKCRDVARRSTGHIISGNKGYKLTLDATEEEFNECNGRLRSQAREMLRRVVEQRKVYHRRN